jgi:hypothetical protein
MQVERGAGREAAGEQQVCGAVDGGVELAPRPPPDRAVGVLDDEERPVREARRLVGERAPQRPGADDVQCFFQ